MGRCQKISPDEKKRRLIEGIRLLASDHAIQLSVFPDFVHKPDEIALLFDETNRCLGELMDAGLVTEKQAKLIQKMDNLLDKMSGQGNAVLWTPEAIKSDEKWESV